MKITDNRPVAPPSRRRGVDRTQSGGNGAFAPEMRPGPAGPAPATPLTALGAILAAQEVEDPGVDARRAVEHGHRVLDELQELHLALIDGWLSEDQLHRLAVVVEEARPDADDPDLASVLDDIELRAGVELAKLERHRS